MLLCITNFTVYTQENEMWFSFSNQDTTKIGFKDKSGIVKIEPKFMGLTSAKKFKDIIAVTEEVNEKWRSYYLTKTGKIVGIDSLHIFDNGSDCESEGFIRFRDSKTDKVGMYDKEGKIVIPCEYSGLSRVKNGLISALKGAKKKYEKGDEHYSWIGGKELLIDINNKVLVENFKNQDEINFFSIKIEKKKSKNKTRKSFLGVNGNYYSFIDFNKEFKSWLETKLLDNLTKEKLLEFSYDKITWENNKEWKTDFKNDFFEKNFKQIKSIFLELKNKNCDYFISSDGLNPFMYETEDFSIYYNNCGESKEWIYPTMSIIISYKDKEFSQNHLEFLRTEKGYKLLSVSIRKGEIK